MSIIQVCKDSNKTYLFKGSEYSYTKMKSTLDSIVYVQKRAQVVLIKFWRESEQKSLSQTICKKKQINYGSKYFGITLTSSGLFKLICIITFHLTSTIWLKLFELILKYLNFILLLKISESAIWGEWRPKFYSATTFYEFLLSQLFFLLNYL